MVEQLDQAILCFQEGRLAESKALFDQLRESSPALLTVKVYLAQLSVLEGKGAEQLASMTELVQRVPYNAEAFYALGMCLQQTKQLPQAAEAFHKALALVGVEEPQVEGRFVSPRASGVFASDIGESVLWQTLALLKGHGVHAFASAGTLLGLERSGSLLPQDKDLDIGIDWLQMNATVTILEANGWSEASRSYDLMNPRCFKHLQTGITLDVCGFGTDTATGEAISGLWMDEVPFHWNRITYFPAIELCGRDSPVGKVWHLSEPVKFLSALYGETWHAPDPHFDTIVCAHNLRHFSWLALCYGYARLYVHWQRGDSAKALSVVRALLKHVPQDSVLKHIEKKLLAVCGKRVLALGFFDLFHRGHLNYLHFARQQGDRLIVGVAPDRFSELGKGYAPVMDEMQRRNIVSALSVVDETCLVQVPMTQTQAAADWIHSLKVSVVVCGDEWQGSERWNKLTQALAEHSIEVVYAPKTNGISTSQVKKRAAELAL